MGSVLPVRASPKVALCGNIANNAYNMACILRRQGIFAQLEDDGSDLFPFARPIWEDRPLVLPYEVIMFHSWDAREWRRLEAGEGWSAEDVVVSTPRRSAWRRWRDRLRRSSAASRIRTAVRQGYLSDAAAKLLFQHAAALGDSIDWLSGFDLVIAFGFQAAVKAYFADKTTIYVTYGGDIRVLLQDPQGVAPDRAEAMAFLLGSERFAIEGYGCDREIHHVLAAKCLTRKLAYGFLPNVNTRLLAMPRDPAGLRESLGWPSDGPIFFMASRIDEKWKRSGVFIDAFSDFVTQGGVATLVVTGWGADFDSLQRRLTDNPRLAARVILLDECYAKPRLFDLFAAADVIVDQFAVGSLGSVSFEALCLGRPVLTYLAPFNLMGYPCPPPILNARTKADILRLLRACTAQPERLPAIGLASAEWFRKVYSEANLAQAVQLLTERGVEAWPTFHKKPSAPPPLPVPDHLAHIVLMPRPGRDDLRRLRMDIEGSARDGVRLRLYAFSGALREEELAGLSLALWGDFSLSGIDLHDGNQWRECSFWQQKPVEDPQELASLLHNVPVECLNEFACSKTPSCRLVWWPGV